jgi:hypothetical protein
MSNAKSKKLPLLRSESSAEYLALCSRLQQEIRPRGAVEEIYLEDIAALIWEIQRLRRFRIITIQQSMPQAMQAVLQQLLFTPDIFERFASETEAKRLSEGWLAKNPDDKKQVRELLRQFDLDEAAFEAEAMRVCADHLEYLDCVLVTARARLDKAMRLIMDYRASFAKRVRQQSDQLLQNNQRPTPIGIDHDASDDQREVA